MRIPSFLTTLALSFLVSADPIRAAETAPGENVRPKVVAYVPNWIDLRTFTRSIAYDKVTHLNIAFENPGNDEGDFSYDRSYSALIAEAHKHGVKVLISIGGGAASDDAELKPRYFSLIAETKRAAFAAKLAAYVTSHGFDGLDVDLEGPSINKDYGTFIRELAGLLKPQGKLLTAALSKGYGGAKVPDAALADLDFVNIMAYDGAGYWAPDAPGQHSSIEFARADIAYWRGRGLPDSKMVLGVPFYGYGFGQAFRRRPYSYEEILSAFPGAEDRDQVGETIWYNGRPTIRAKCQLVLEEKLGGVMIWSLDNDVRDERSLLSVIHETLNATAKPPVAVTP
jgi:chitinase